MDQPAPRRDSRFAAFLAVLVVGGSGLGVLIYQARQNRERPVLDASGFNLAATADTAPGRSAPRASSARSPEPSSLGMVKSGMPGLEFGAKSGAAVPRDPAAALAVIVRGGEARTRALFIDYKRRYPVLRQYERDWANSPDLKKLHEDYLRDHDPAAFLRGLVPSRNFQVLIKKYAAEPALRDFVKESIKTAPPGFFSAGPAFLKGDKGVKALAGQVCSALGLPVGMLEEGAGDTVNQKAVMDSVMKSHPELRNAADNQGK